VSVAFPFFRPEAVVAGLRSCALNLLAGCAVCRRKVYCSCQSSWHSCLQLIAEEWIAWLCFSSVLAYSVIQIHVASRGGRSPGEDPTGAHGGFHLLARPQDLYLHAGEAQGFGSQRLFLSTLGNPTVFSTVGHLVRDRRLRPDRWIGRLLVAPYRMRRYFGVPNRLQFSFKRFQLGSLICKTWQSLPNRRPPQSIFAGPSATPCAKYLIVSRYLSFPRLGLHTSVTKTVVLRVGKLANGFANLYVVARAPWRQYPCVWLVCESSLRMAFSRERIKAVFVLVLLFQGAPLI
jgi:hypothetical protein